MHNVVIGNRVKNGKALNEVNLILLINSNARDSSQIISMTIKSFAKVQCINYQLISLTHQQIFISINQHIKSSLVLGFYSQNFSIPYSFCPRQKDFFEVDDKQQRPNHQ